MKSVPTKNINLDDLAHRHNQFDSEHEKISPQSAHKPVPKPIKEVHPLTDLDKLHAHEQALMQQSHNLHKDLVGGNTGDNSRVALPVGKDRPDLKQPGDAGLRIKNPSKLYGTTVPKGSRRQKDMPSHAPAFSSMPQDA